MLQKKLVIAMCAIFALSACGGDDNDDQSKIVLNPPEDINPPVEEEEEEEEDGSIEWLNVTFDEEASVESWAATCVSSECNATATLAYNAEAQAMNVTPDFLTAGDQIEVSTAIDPEIADLANGNAHLNLYVPEAYAGMVAQVFFQDASDRKGYIGYTNTTAGWNTFSFEALEAGTGVDDDFGSFGFHSEGFDLTLINRMGVQIQSAEGFPELNGTLHIDDAIVSPEAIEVADKGGEEEPTDEEPIAGAPEAPPAGDITYHFDSGIDGWHIDGTGDATTTDTEQMTLSHDSVNGALSITPKSWDAIADNYRYKARVATEGQDLSNALVRTVIYVPQAYITDGGLAIQVIPQSEAATSYDAYFGAADLQAGFNVLDIDLSDDGTLVTASEFIGVQLSAAPTDTSINEPILVSSFDVYLDGTVPSNTQSVPVDAGWSNDSTPSTISYNNGVVIAPDWSAGTEQKAFGLTDGPIDLTGATITYVVDVPEAYITDGGMVIQPFAQQNGDPGYEGIFDGDLPGGWNPASSLQAGENTIVFGPFDAPPVNIERIGLNLLEQDKAEGVTGDVTVKSVTITFPE